MLTARRALTGLLTVLATLALYPAAGAEAATTVRIAAPQAGSVKVGRTVDVRVRIRGEARGVSAFVHSRHGTRDVRAPFRRRGSTWTARLRAGADLRPGPNRLFVRVRRQDGTHSSATARFVLATKRADLASALPTGNPLRPRLRLRPGARFVARLNGRGVRRAFERAGARTWRADLRPRHGARFGRNRVRVVAYDQAGRYEVVQLGRVVRRVRPIADAGADRVVHPRALTRLDGRRSLATRRGRRLAFRWRIVKRPRGSKARLARPRSARPRLLRAAPGHYSIRLVVSERGRGRARAAAVAHSDTVSVAVQQPAGPAGVPIATIGDSIANPGVTVGSRTYPGSLGFFQIVVLDRRTLTPSSSVGNPNTVVALESLSMSLEGIADQVDDSDLVIVAGSGSQAYGSLPTNGIDQLVTQLQQLGSDIDSSNLDPLFEGQYSLIGIVGLPPGSAFENIGGRQPGLLAGGIQGRLMVDRNSTYSFRWPSSFVTFDTQAPGSTPTQHRVQIAGQTYVSDNVTAEHGGFHLVWVDADNLAPRGNFTFENCWGDGNCTDGLVDQLNTILSDPRPGLIVFSTLNVSDFIGSNETQGGLLEALEQFGANESAYMDAEQYALVGLAGLGGNGPSRGLDIATGVARTSSTRLGGVLRRDNQGNWRAGTNGNPAAGGDVTDWQPAVQRVLAQPAQPFPALDGPGQAAAVQYIADAIDEPHVQSAADLRALYWLDDDIDWSDKRSTLMAMAPCSAAACAKAFPQVRTTLANEWDQVATVRSYFTGGESTDVYGVYENVFTDSTLGFVAIANDILHTYKPPSQSSGQGPEGVTVFDGVLTLGQGLAGFLPIAGDEVSNALTVVQGVEEVIDTVATTSSGTSSLDPSAIEGDIYSVGTTMQNAFGAQVSALSNVADIVVSDAGRLSAAAAGIGTPGSQGGWGMDSTSATNLSNALQRSIAQYTWTWLLPSIAQVYTCDPMQRVPGTPALAQALLSYWTSEIANGSGPPYQPTVSWAYLAAKDSPTDFLDSATLQTLFGSDTSKQQLGLQHQYFMRWSSRAANGDPVGAGDPPHSAGFPWVQESRDGGACRAGE